MRPLLLAVSLLAAAPALADWEGTVHFTHDPPRPGAGSDKPGRIHVKKGKVRVDQAMPMGDMVLLMDFKSKSFNMLMPARKQYMSMDGASAQSATMPPSCLDQKVDACLAGQGFKKGAGETVSGRKTTIWEQDRDSPMGKVQQKLWVVDGAKELMFLRQTTTSARGSTKTEVSDVKETPQADALFEVPAGYTKMEMGPGAHGPGAGPHGPGPGPH